MFKDDYGRAMDAMKPSPDKRAEILGAIDSTAPKKAKNPATPWRIGFALTAAAAIVLTAAFGNIIKKPDISISGDTVIPLAEAKSYDDIYKKLKTIKVQAGYDTEEARDNGISMYAKEYSAVADDVAATGSATPDYSDTTVQVEGVDEADIVKTDGKYIYILSDDTVRIVKANDGKPRLVHTITLPDDGERHFHDMYLSGDRLVVISSVYKDFGSSITNGKYATLDMVVLDTDTEILFYNISDPAAPKLIGQKGQSGGYNSSRMIDGVLYTISNHNLNPAGITKGKPDTFVPEVFDGNTRQTVAPEDIMCPTEEIKNTSYLVVCSYSADTTDFISNFSLLGDCNTVYSSKDNIITANEDWSDGLEGAHTWVSRFSIKNGDIKYVASQIISGTLINQFAIDQHKGYFRFVTTSNKIDENGGYSSQTTQNGLYILDSELHHIGKIEGLAEGERVYSVRFMGDTAYFVTFKQVDPLFSADLSDPKKPKIIGELKIPGFSEYLYPYGDGLLLGIGQEVRENTLRTDGVKLSMFNIADPSNVTEQNKTVISGSNYSEALDNHKACIVRPDKNLIGFAVTGKSNSFGDIYVVYSYSGDGFTELARIKCDDYMSKRGLFIGDVFYIVGQKSVRAFNIDDFSPLGVIKF